MFFSVIVPVYNKGLYLERCLSSICRQQFRDFEVLLLDDGSDDNSKDIADRYVKQDSRFSYYYHHNQGVSYTRNEGIIKSKGDYLLFVDADDSIEDTYLLNIMEQMKQNLSCSIYILSLTKIYVNGFKQKLAMPYNGYVAIEAFKKTFVSIQENTGIYGFVCNKVVNRDFVLKNNIHFDETKKLAEDLDFFVKCYVKVDSVCFITEYGYNYYQETVGSSVENRDIDYLGLVDTYTRIYDWLSNNSENVMLLVDKIGRFIYSSFVEKPRLRKEEVDRLVLCYFTNEAVKSILSKRSKNIIFFLLRKRQSKMLFCYLRIRKILVYVKAYIIRTWRKCKSWL